MKTLTKYYEDLVLNPEPNCFCMLKPGFAEYKDEFEKLLNLQGWKIIAQCIKKFTRDEIEDFYIMHKDKPFYHKLCDYMITDDCVCYTCYKNCQDPFKDMDSFKKKIRDEWGEDEMKNGMHSSDCKENMKKECLIAFNSVNEKLKVSAKDTVSMTNEEFFNLLLEYTKVENTHGLITAKVHNEHDREMPLYSGNITRYINIIKPHTGGHNEIILELRDVYEGKYAGYTEINVDKGADIIVSFTSEDWLLCIIKYMQDIIKTRNYI